MDRCTLARRRALTALIAVAAAASCARRVTTHQESVSIAREPGTAVDRSAPRTPASAATGPVGVPAPVNTPAPAANPGTTAGITGYRIDDSTCYVPLTTPAAAAALPAGVSVERGDESLVSSHDPSAAGRTTLAAFLASYPTREHRFVIVEDRADNGPRLGWVAFCVFDAPLVTASDVQLSAPRLYRDAGPRLVRDATLSAVALARIRALPQAPGRVLFVTEPALLHAMHPLERLSGGQPFPLGFDP